MNVDPHEFETTLDPNHETHVGIWRDEVTDPSDEFFRWDVAGLTDVQRSALAAGEQSAGPSMALTRVTELLEPGYLPIETGLCRTSGDELCVAVWTPFPGSTPEMLDWWMGWHLTRTERYKLWHPQAHVFAQARYDYSGISGLSDLGRYVGNTSWVDEYLGPVLSRLAITFHEPGSIGLSGEVLENSGYGTAIVAEVTDRDSGKHLCHLVHVLRRTVYGCEMRSRFYFTDGTPEVMGPWMLDHCATEMRHLASLLPTLYSTITGQGPYAPIGASEPNHAERRTYRSTGTCCSLI